MADNYLEKRMEDFKAQPAARRKSSASLRRLLRANRSYRGYDASFEVREDQLRRIIEVATLCPSARNQQVLRFRPVLKAEADKVLPHIRLGGALPDLHLPFAGTEPNAFVVICSTVEESKYVDIDLGIVAQSMLLQAAEIGLGGICIGAFDHEPVRENLALKYNPVLVMAIGRPAEHIELRECREGDSLTYYREGGIHYVPKISIDDLILK
jgi:nitroreductase